MQAVAGRRGMDRGVGLGVDHQAQGRAHLDCSDPVRVVQALDRKRARLQLDVAHKLHAPALKRQKIGGDDRGNHNPEACRLLGPAPGKEHRERDDAHGGCRQVDGRNLLDDGDNALDRIAGQDVHAEQLGKLHDDDRERQAHRHAAQHGLGNEVRRLAEIQDPSEDEPESDHHDQHCGKGFGMRVDLNGRKR